MPQRGDDGVVLFCFYGQTWQTDSTVDEGERAWSCLHQPILSLTSYRFSYFFLLKFYLIVKFIFNLSVLKPSNCNQIKKKKLPLELNNWVPMFWKMIHHKCKHLMQGPGCYIFPTGVGGWWVFPPVSGLAPPSSWWSHRLWQMGNMGSVMRKLNTSCC